jgi:surface antigen
MSCRFETGLRRTHLYPALTLFRQSRTCVALLATVFVVSLWRLLLRRLVMRPSESLPAVIATAFAGVFLAVFTLLAPSLALASEPASLARNQPVALGPDFRNTLDDADEVATLDAIHTALSEVGDGGTYVWHRQHGRLSAIMQPTQSFKDSAGQVCRHLVVMLVSGAANRRTEGIACRLSTGRWQLDG